jgi:putative lipoic acid-binding regulatory protein
MPSLNQNSELLLTFPCDFVIKVFGFASDEFEIAALTIIHKHTPDLLEGAIQARPSRQGKYLALNITIHATSKSQLDNIYTDLSACPQVLMAL